MSSNNDANSGKQPIPKKAATSVVGSIAIDFTQRINAIRLFAQKIGPFADESDDAINRQHADAFLNSIGVRLPPNAKPGSVRLEVTRRHVDDIPAASRTEVHLTDEAMRRLRNVMRDIRRGSTSHGRILRESTLVTAVSQLDALIASLIRAFYTLYPGVLKGDEYKLSYKELIQFESLAMARDFVMNKRIDAILYSSLMDQLDFFRKERKIDLSYLDPYLGILNETVQRRNVHVHNLGRASTIYLSRVGKDVVSQLGCKEGDELPVDSRYLTRAIDRVNLAGLILSQQCWRKWCDGEHLAADEALNENLLDTLTEKRFVAAQYIGQYGMKVCTKNDATRRNVILNYAQSFLWAGKADKAREVVDGVDWSACSLRYQLAAMAIRRDWEGVRQILPITMAAKDISPEDFDVWPIFQEVRNDQACRALVDEHRSSRK